MNDPAENVHPRGRPISVIRSIVSPETLLAEVTANYPIGGPLYCSFIGSTTNDHYLVTAGDARYVLRLYRAGHRSVSDIAYELPALVHLHDKGVPVSYPIARADGRT